MVRQLKLKDLNTERIQNLSIADRFPQEFPSSVNAVSPPSATKARKLFIAELERISKVLYTQHAFAMLRMMCSAHVHNKRAHTIEQNFTVFCATDANVFALRTNISWFHQQAYAV